MKMFSILSLLPQCSETQIPTHLKFSKILNLLQFFIKETIKALENFYLNNHLYDFDPHVGETSCQIRAYQILILASNITIFDRYAIQKKILAFKEILSKIDHDIPHYLKVDSTKRNKNESTTTLKKFIKNNAYYFEINKIEFFLIQAYILTIYKRYDSNNNYEIAYDKLCNDLEVSKNSVRKLVHKYQISLSESSCEFVKNVLNETPNNILSSEFLNNLKYTDDDERNVLPCYLVVKIIMSNIKYKKKPILLLLDRRYNGKTIDNILLPFFTVTNEHYFLIDTNLLDSLLHEKFYVLKGVTTYKDNKIETKQKLINRILNVGLENIILFNMAAHPQYSGKKLKHLSENPFSSCNIQLANATSHTFEDEFLLKKLESSVFGCNSINSSLFYIEHIFCDTLNRYKDLIESTLLENNNEKLEFMSHLTINRNFYTNNTLL